jgi:hypothetical protein
MDSGENLERRVAAVEVEVVLARQEAAAARALAAGADRDVADYRAEMRAHTRGLVALRETQLEHYAEHKADMAQVKADMTEVKADIVQVKADITDVKAGMGHIVRLVENLGGGLGRRES